MEILERWEENGAVRKSWKVYVLFICIFLFCTSCGMKKNEETTEKTKVTSYKEKNVMYDVIETPDEANSKQMANMYVNVSGSEYPRMILKLIQTNSESYEYIEYQLQDDFTWRRTKIAWSDKISEMSPNGIKIMVADSKGELYASAYDREKRYVLYRLSDNGEIYKLNVSEVLNTHKGVEPSTFDIINDYQLAFLFSENSEQIGGKCDVVFYDLIEEKVLEQGSAVSDQIIFDEEGNYYTLSFAQPIIQKYTIHDSMPNKVIQCDGISPSTMISDLLISDDKGYLKTSYGIYGGKLNEEQWDNVIIAVDNMYYNKEIATFQSQPLLSFSSFIKVPGDDTEFFVKTFRDEEYIDFDWVHYRCN